MKKEFLTGLALLCAVTSPALADGKKTFGTVEQVTVEDSAFTVRGDDGHLYRFNVNEMTEMEKNGKWMDEEITLTDLSTGDRVQVEYFADNPDYLIVDEVEIMPPKSAKQMKSKKKK